MPNETQFAAAILVHGSPPWRRPDAFPNAHCKETWPMKLDAIHDWQAWATTIRTMAREQEWIVDFNGWDTWLKAFFVWYDEETKHDSTQA